MIPPVILPIVRRAILDLLDAIGGEQSDDTLQLQLLQLGHRVARRDVAEQMRWLAEHGLIEIEDLSPYLVARMLPDGVDAAAGRLTLDGIGRHKTGKPVGTAS
ncbi:hypothetical protein LZK98_08300 [Sphingomonas cannabina]|uniref:hypothetical protein n=1 Tax=Sphingomonas cannabina TaxID=2899123 RepID=UPI001F213CCB|nr:hypothetical protein [Sphingomonas cannabina]UIJ46930.1 hypothetical protein LZK98_08300 [Sphingomonas cannabina]